MVSSYISSLGLSAGSNSWKLATYSSTMEHTVVPSETRQTCDPLTCHALSGQPVFFFITRFEVAL